MPKLTENAWIDGVGYGPGFGDRQPPTTGDTPADLAQPPGEDVPADPSTAEGVVEAVESFQKTVLRVQLGTLTTKAEMAAFAERHELDVDNRLGAAKMRAALEELLAPDDEPGEVAP